MNRTLLVTAGPTREYLDDVRYLTNDSSGRLGVAVAAAAQAAGLRVHLALGPCATPPPAGVEVYRFVTAQELSEIARRLWPSVDALVATAAVGDFRPVQRVPGKRKKSAGAWTIELVANPDVLAERARDKGSRVLVGFALEAVPELAEARRKLVEKRLDLIILNTPANLGSAAGDFQWVEASGAVERLHHVSKDELAERIVRFVREFDHE